MTALLKLIPVETIILYVLRLLTGVSKEQWLAALKAILDAAKGYTASSDKLTYVKSELTKYNLSEKALNFLVEAGVSFLKSKGKI